ncbi:glycosyl hydrolase family 18 protein [Marininema halotolerans]|uniref:Glycosyl hydrolases family 18 n=1 Tax=Marininema halotolerans TaxID=1155944 RepID=A0A1I6SGM8_9BACL|nr:glycosyl hydrolase family 18 protein [Marininema halotolerans]SFS75990.1 Glycosyl hydrolases family 18 [Marininema halotolerans]
MSALETQHREFLSWIQTVDHLGTVERYGNKFTGVCLFWLNIQADGSLTEAINDWDAAMEKARQVREKWPHIRWLLTIKNDGLPSRITPIVKNEQGEQDRLMQAIHRVLDQHPWIDGIDADLERLPNDQVSGIYQLYERLYQEVKGRSSGHFVHVDLPPMYGPYDTIGPEKWCSYERLKDFCDTAQIMTYGFAWSGSAPGSTSPIEWQKRVMRYAVQAFAPEQVLMGIPAYGHRWEISRYPKSVDKLYRGYSGGFPDFLRWMVGDLSHTDVYRGGAETQAYIPFFSFYEEEDAVHRLFLHVYDYVDAGDEDDTNLHRDAFGDKAYLTAYGKSQQVEFEQTVSEQKISDADLIQGAMVKENTYIAPRKPTTGEKEGYAKWTFSVPKKGTYDIVSQVQFPWFDQQKLTIKIDGTSYTVGDVPQHYPYHRLIHWFKLARLSLTAGNHVLEVFGSGSQVGTVFYGFRVCARFQEAHEAGDATFTLRPRKFVDRDQKEAWPYENQLKATVEAIRRPPDAAIIYYDDFRDWKNKLPGEKYDIQSGSWKVMNDQGDSSPRPYSWVSGTGKVTLSYSQFKDVIATGNIRVEKNGKAGLMFSNLWFCLNMNYAGGRYELYQGNQLLAYQWPNGSLELNQYYRMALKVRGKEVIGSLNNRVVIRHTLSSEVGKGAWGIQGDVPMSCDLLVGADACWYAPQEAIDLVLPDQSVQTLGRIPRKGVTWDEQWGLFYLASGDEYDTRVDPVDGMEKDISMDWDYLHSTAITLTEGDYPVTIRMRDQGVSLSSLYLGDADGFSVAVFPFAETQLKQADIAAYEWKVRGVGLWAVGQEDPQLWQMLVDHV